MDLRACAAYTRTWRGGVLEETAGSGQGLARALDRVGPGGLAALLVEGVDLVELEDAEVALTVERRPGGLLRVRTQWAGGETAEQELQLEIPVLDLADALHDGSRALHYREGTWFEGVPPGAATFVLPSLAPEQLGSPSFRAAHELRYAYVAGAMAGGIASAELVLAMGNAGMLGYFGAGGLPLEAVEAALSRIPAESAGRPFGFNLLHNPAEPGVESRTVDLYLAAGVRDVDASAFMGLTPSVLRYRLHGIREVDGRIVVPNRLCAKVSRPEVAQHFMRPAPEKMLQELVAAGVITADQARLARRVPVAEDITAEADSGGHTDRRPLPVLIPIFRRLADRISAEEGYPNRLRVGAAGGIGDPWSLAAALQLGADYVMTGSVNQCTPEAGTSDEVRDMLAQAGYADVVEGPAPDMFEIGAQVQVLSRGTMYAQRASRLYELYRAYDGLDAIPAADRSRVEKQIFLRPIDEVWAETEAYWRQRDVREVERAAKEPRHRMALTFRWYLGMSSRWARIGDPARKRDYQIWCGPAMGLFNDWVRGSALEAVSKRGVVTIADALLRGACGAMRVQAARAAGIPLPVEASDIRPPA
ncbi:MAG: PfaD family polyunsaturated fatty acid/polyketide biosynthesis protein [Myxococcales bacterium]|nr:PfaD family polyunsaturated fatty acid/polyketide biosynthesis protein [Myxococcales bacterium]